MYTNFEWMSYSWLGSCLVHLWLCVAEPLSQHCLRCYMSFTYFCVLNVVTAVFPWCDACLFSWFMESDRPLSLLGKLSIWYQSIPGSSKGCWIDDKGCPSSIFHTLGLNSTLWNMLVVYDCGYYFMLSYYFGCSKIKNIYIYTCLQDKYMCISKYIYIYSCVVLRCHCCKMLQVPEINRVSSFTFLCNTIGSHNSMGPFTQLSNLSMLPIHLRAPWSKHCRILLLFVSGSSPNFIHGTTAGWWFVCQEIFIFDTDDCWMILVGFLFEESGLPFLIINTLGVRSTMLSQSTWTFLAIHV